jgi:2-polyprenyl-3-methyl-5-hydroxy-6-metoxy-1,4-benzoquinol methylase
MDTDRDRVRARARQLSAEALAAGDATGWFEKLYAEAEAGQSVIPWADGLPNPHLVSWAQEVPGGLDGAGRPALVVGCGLGYDAEFLAGCGFDVTAFDVAPTAIAGAMKLYPDSTVHYVTADLVALPAEWAGAFDLVLEAYTLQPLYGPVRAKALAAVSGPVAPGGTLLVISLAADSDALVRDPAMMPWPLTRAARPRGGAPLHAHRIEQFTAEENPRGPHWRAEFRRD